MLSNGYFLNAAAWYADLGGVLAMRDHEERLYNPLPMIHINPLVMSLGAMILRRGCLIVPDRFHPSRWWADLVATGATCLHYLGLVVPLLLSMPRGEDEARAGETVRWGMGGGMEPRRRAEAQARFGFPLVELWGMTELGRCMSDNVEPRQPATRAIGRPTRDLEASVVDADGIETAPGVEGELVVRARGDDPRRWFFSGYLRDAQATEEAWRGGWFHTGDLVRRDPGGRIHFVDRIKNIVRRSGENVAATEVELALAEHPDAAEVAVIAVPDALRDEEVMACVVPRAGRAGDATLAGELFERCTARLAYYKAPGWIAFVASLPVTSTRKVKKAGIFPPDVDPRASAFDLRDRKRRG